MKVVHAFALLLFSAVVLGAPRERTLRSYPFTAPPERETQIRTNYKRVAPGMSSAEVTKVLGEPDEIHTLYEPRVSTPKAVGYTQWYIIRRLAASGSVNEKQESLVRVSFDLNDRVTKTDAWGL